MGQSPTQALSLNMEPMLFTHYTQVPGCSNSGIHHKGHPLPYGINCALALAEECGDESKDISACGMEEQTALPLPGPLPPGKSLVVDSAAPALAEQHPKPLDRTAHKEPVALITTMTTITTRGSSVCSLAVLSTRLGQQDEQLATDRCHISKVLDCLLDSHTPMTTLAEVTAVPSTSPVSSTAPPGQAPSLPQ